MERLLDGRRRACLTTSDGNWPVAAVAIVILDIEIALRFAKIRHHLFIRPFVVAESRPGVEILREAALHRLTVDRRPAADHFALRDVNFALFLSNRAVQSPVVF